MNAELNPQGLQLALQLAKGATGLAKLIGHRVKRQNVEHWVKVDRLPEEHCPTVEKELGVPCEDLRPDVQWLRVKDKTWPHPKGRPVIDVARAAIVATDAAKGELAHN